ncbi:MAG: N-formylglutamate deformylase [Ideonella sp.]|nr:N-formylglutamate deformylase [Ideonella sp.]MCC7455513.1 N-formylglutamate deformylase [Nitrospira sp.]
MSGMNSQNERVYTLHRGNQPLLVSVPHAGIEMPEDQHGRYVQRALQFEDTDWHLATLYDFVRSLGASLLVPRFSRYLIDLNRPKGNAPMYPGANNTELCPTRFFSGEALYRAGYAPDANEIARRISLYWQPYHDALRTELDRIRGVHGHVVLFDGHSIKSELPWLFEGRLPDLNLGTAAGESCAASLRAALGRVLDVQAHYTHVVDGRFKGGFITRHYGAPAQDVHAVQLEMCWSCYMAERPPYELDGQRMARLMPVLSALVHSMLRWTPA